MYNLFLWKSLNHVHSRTPDNYTPWKTYWAKWGKKYDWCFFHHRLAQNMWKIFSLVPSKKPLARETDTIKSWVILQNFNSRMLILAKTLILPNYQVPNDVFVNLTIQESKFCKVAQLFIASVSLVRGCFEREKENIFHIFWAIAPLNSILFVSILYMIF